MLDILYVLYMHVFIVQCLFFVYSDPDFESDYYFKPYTRASPWLIGFLGGYIITKTKKNIKMHKVVLFIGWMCCLTILGAIILGGHTIDDIQHKNTTFEHISYLALSRPAWALALLWIILVCYYGYGGN